MSTYKKLHFTTTELLILEVLTARARLGNKNWTFESRNATALCSLETRGLIDYKYSYRRSTLVWLTDAGVALMLKEKYHTPVPFTKLQKLQRQLRKRAKRIIS